MPAVKKTTYSLDGASLEKLNKLARSWQVSKTEVLRRALSKADQSDIPSPEERIAALHELQRWAKEAKIDLEEWKRMTKHGRR